MDLGTNTHQDHEKAKRHLDDLANHYRQTHIGTKRYMIRLHKWADERHMHLHRDSHLRAAASNRETDAICRD